MELPADIRKEWINLVRRILSVVNSCQEQGLLVVNISIVIDKNGRPVLWTPPSVTHLEPERVSKEADTRIGQL